MQTDYLIVGSGLTGATIARLLADAGREVLVVDRRSHIGGNVYDHCHPSGIRVHTYGPHYFRCNSQRIWDFVNRFAGFYNYEACLKSRVDGEYESWPIAATYIRRTVGSQWQPAFRGTPRNFEEASLALMPQLVYDRFVKGYTEKQWGVPASSLSPTLATRFDVRQNDDPRLTTHKYQGLPLDGYALLMEHMLSGIPVVLNCDYLRYRGELRYRKLLVFTGPIDEFYGYRFGTLQYRGQRREHHYVPHVGYAQPCGQVNNPDPGEGPHIRTLEWKHMMPPEYASQITGTVLTTEVAISPTESNNYEYPFPSEANLTLYKQYRNHSAIDQDVLICGRLGEYRYYDMDHAIARAMTLYSRIVATSA